MAYPQQRANGWGQFVNPEYNRLQSQIQQQTQALLRQREQFSGINGGGGNNFIVQQPYLRPVQSQKYLKLNSDRSNYTNNPIYNGNMNYNNNNYNQQQQLINQNQNSRQNQPQPQNIMSDKVRQLMQLCRRDNSQLSNQLMRVLNQQRNVYNELLSNGQSSQKTQYFGVNNPIIQAQKQSSVNLNSRKSQQQQQIVDGGGTMIMNYSNSNSSGNHTPQRGGSAGFVNVMTGENVHNNNNNNRQHNLQVTLGKGNIINNPNNNLNTNTMQLQLGDDLIQMIQQIQRKALNEIEKLRQEKIDLMKQLKQQIQGNNQLQKEINILSQQQQQSGSQSKVIQQQQLYQPLQQHNKPQSPQNLQQQILNQIRTQMNNLRKQNQSLRNFNTKLQFEQKQKHQKQNNQLITGQGYPNVNPNQVYTLRQRVNVLEGQLRSRDQFIKELSLQIKRLNQQGGSTNSYQITSLLQQGQAIRQQTLQLIRFKQGQLLTNYNQPQQGTFPFNDQQRIRQLQQLLQRQQEEKQNFLNDLLNFKQKYQQLEEENRMLKRQSKISSSDIVRFSPIYDKSTIGQGVANSVDDYQRILSQMRGVARY